MHDVRDRLEQWAEGWVDRRVVDNAGGVVGVIVDVYADAATLQPAWLAIGTGYFGRRVVVAPLPGASLVGDDVVVAHRVETITAAPGADVVVAVTPELQRHLVAHYGLSESRPQIRTTQR